MAKATLCNGKRLCWQTTLTDPKIVYSTKRCLSIQTFAFLNKITEHLNKVKENRTINFNIPFLTVFGHKLVDKCFLAQNHETSHSNRKPYIKNECEDGKGHTMQW